MEKDKFLSYFNNFYALLQEANLYRDNQEVVNEVNLESDPFINEQLKIVRRYRAKFLADQNKNRTEQLSKVIFALKNEDDESLVNLLGESYSQQAIALYSNFKKISKEDNKSINEEKLFLALIEVFENEEKSQN
jgi:hypothetical protein